MHFFQKRTPHGATGKGTPELGFIPVLVVLAETDFVEAASLDSDYFGDKEFVRAGEAAEAFYSEFNPVLVVNSDGTLSLPAHPTEEP
jgi:hypothetical protein